MKWRFSFWVFWDACENFYYELNFHWTIHNVKAITTRFHTKVFCVCFQTGEKQPSDCQITLKETEFTENLTFLQRWNEIVVLKCINRLNSKRCNIFWEKCVDKFWLYFLWSEYLFKYWTSLPTCVCQNNWYIRRYALLLLYLCISYSLRFFIIFFWLIYPVVLVTIIRTLQDCIYSYLANAHLI